MDNQTYESLVLNQVIPEWQHSTHGYNAWVNGNAAVYYTPGFKARRFVTTQNGWFKGPTYTSVLEYTPGYFTFYWGDFKIYTLKTTEDLQKEVEAAKERRQKLVIKRPTESFWLHVNGDKDNG